MDEDQNGHKIIILSELAKIRQDQELELERYREKLIDLEAKIDYLQRDADLTNMIINLIETDNIIYLDNFLKKKQDD